MLLYLINRATKRPTRPSEFLGLRERFPPETCIDFDMMVELFDQWVEERKSEMMDAPAPPRNDKIVRVPRYQSIQELLGLDEGEDEATEEEIRVADLFASGEVDIDDLLNGDLGDLLAGS